MPAFLLVHSPLVGPYTWEPVAEQLRLLGHEAVMPRLRNDKQDARPFVEQHAYAIAQAYQEQLEDKSVVLVGHSGAGVLLPYAAQMIGGVAGYIFVDADLPRDGVSRFALFPPDEVARIRQTTANGYMPLWTEEALAKVIPDAQTRQRFSSELRPTPLTVYEQPISVPPGWPDAPCAYLSFSNSNAYADAIKSACEQGWAFGELPGYHFHMLVDPTSVAQALIMLAGQLG